MALFNINGGFAKFVNRALDVLWLNLLWIVFSLPLITVGASTCAAFSVTLKMVDEEEGYIGKQFLQAFKSNFKQGTIMWCITAPLLYFAYLVWQVIIVADEVNFLLILGAILYSAILIAIILYTYPLIARYENTLPNMIKNSIGITTKFFGRTVFIVLMVAIEIVIIFWNRWTMLAGLLIGPEFIIYTISGISKRIFQKIDRGEDANSGTINQ